jgi:L-cysteine/cystine lyase
MQCSAEEIEAFRKHFAGMDGFVNYQWGGYSSKPRPVLEETMHWLEFEGRIPAGPEIGAEVQEMVQRTRGRIARHVGASDGEIALTGHTSAGINIVAWGLGLKPGERVVLSRHEHAANVIPWYNLAERTGCSVEFLDAHQEAGATLEDAERLLRRGSCRVLAVSHVSRHTGYRLPVKELSALAHRHGVFVLIDGAQSAGSIPIDVKEIGCDAYSFCGHKWFLGPQGTGALYVAAERMGDVKPSWVGSKSQSSFDWNGHWTPRPDMQRHEFWTTAWALFAGWNKSMEMMESLGYGRIFETISSGVRDFKDGVVRRFGQNALLTPVPWEESSAILAIRLEGLNGRSSTDALWKNDRILVCPLEDPHAVRICSHFINTAAERERFLDALERLAGGR